MRKAHVWYRLGAIEDGAVVAPAVGPLAVGHRGDAGGTCGWGGRHRWPLAGLPACPGLAWAGLGWAGLAWPGLAGLIVSSRL